MHISTYKRKDVIQLKLQVAHTTFSPPVLTNSLGTVWVYFEVAYLSDSIPSTHLMSLFETAAGSLTNP